MEVLKLNCEWYWYDVPGLQKFLHIPQRVAKKLPCLEWNSINKETGKAVIVCVVNV